jgi:hypothetical protein
MKQLNLLFSLCMVLVLATACKKDTFAPIGEAYDLYNPELYNGTWKLQSLLQTDLNAVASAFPDNAQKLELIQEFGFANAILTIKDVTKTQGGKYTLVAPESVPSILPITDSGVVSFEDNAGTTTRTLIFEGYGIRPAPTDPRPSVLRANFTLSKIYRPADNTLGLRFTRKSTDGSSSKDIITYDYTFTR